MPAALEPTDKFLSPGTGFRLLYRLVADNVYAPVTYALPGAASAGASAVTMADGASVALGATSDAPATGDNVAASAIALLKRALQLQTLYAGSAITAAGGLGAGGAGLQGWLSTIALRLPASVGAKTAAQSLAVTLATDDAGIGQKVAAIPGLGSGGSGLQGWLSQIWQVNNRMSDQLPSGMGVKTSTSSLPVVLASDDAQIGTPVTAAGALGAGGTGLQGWISNISLRLPLATKSSAGSLSVTLASDDAQIGTKVAAIAGLGSGGAGIVGWLSQVWQAQSNLSAQLPSTLGIKTAALSLSIAPASDANLARETYSSVVAMTTPTLAAGATFNPFAGQACSQLDLIAPPTVDIEYRRGGAGVAIPVAAGTSRLIQGLANANQIAVRRLDQSATPVNTFAEAYTV